MSKRGRPSNIYGGQRPLTYQERLFVEDPTSNEHKFHDGGVAVISLGNVPNQNASNLIIESFNLVPLGSGPSSRNGRRITIRSLHIRFQITIPERVTDDITDFNAGAFFRVLIIQNHQHNKFAANPLLSEVLNFETGTNNALAYNNLCNKGRFTILTDKFIWLPNPIRLVTDLSPTAFLAHGPVCTETEDIHIRCAIPIEFDGLGIDVPDLTSNNIYAQVVWNYGASQGTNNPSPMRMNMQFRMRFTDD